ncbi:PIR Superfamily Protein [Plasmodium ovale wallikeri]|uniref:PIR Superfamily Protein n=1 Tax=Plasmodium ovale wallikeri TaxID=864142 RepID=A0A1A9AJI0_PLAOA|nr:PIR Superfamily Protein [Plasmodium ovale wallikeri]SBT59044.1 PIR Superfamily Protein [Plasmodium ovale wallikeri]
MDRTRLLCIDISQETSFIKLNSYNGMMHCLRGNRLLSEYTSGAYYLPQEVHFSGKFIGKEQSNKNLQKKKLFKEKVFDELSTDEDMLGEKLSSDELDKKNLFMEKLLKDKNIEYDFSNDELLKGEKLTKKIKSNMKEKNKSNISLESYISASTYPLFKDESTEHWQENCNLRNEEEDNHRNYNWKSSVDSNLDKTEHSQSFYDSNEELNLRNNGYKGIDFEDILKNNNVRNSVNFKFRNLKGEEKIYNIKRNSAKVKFIYYLPFAPFIIMLVVGLIGIAAGSTFGTPLFGVSFSLLPVIFYAMKSNRKNFDKVFGKKKKKKKNAKVSKKTEIKNKLKQMNYDIY